MLKEQFLIYMSLDTFQHVHKLFLFFTYRASLSPPPRARTVVATLHFNHTEVNFDVQMLLSEVNSELSVEANLSLILQYLDDINTATITVTKFPPVGNSCRPSQPFPYGIYFRNSTVV